jgi:integrase
MLATGQINENPADHLDQPTKWKKLPGVLTPSQVRRLLEAPVPSEKTTKGTLPLWIRDRAILELMYASGLRASEVGQIGLIDIMEKIGVVRVLGKGDKQRLVPMGQPAQDALKHYLDECRPLLITPERAAERRDRGKLFLSRTGHPIERVCASGRSSSIGPSRRIFPKHTRTCCVTALPRTCSLAGRICGLSRNCSGTRTSRRPRSTRTWIGRRSTRPFGICTQGVNIGNLRVQHAPKKKGLR